MKELLANNELLQTLANQMKSTVDLINNDIKNLENKEEDLFLRYMSYVRIFNLNNAIKYALDIVGYSLLSGHILSHPSFRTPELEKNGWDMVEIGHHSFFS